MRADYLTIRLTCDSSYKTTETVFDKEFSIPLIDLDYEFLHIPEEEYEAEFILNSKRFYELISQLVVFGNDINFKCDMTEIVMNSNGILGEMKVVIDANDIEEYAIFENEKVNNSFYLNNIFKMCLNYKITPNIELFLSNSKPLKINYKVDESSYISFYIAPKID